MMFRRSFCPSSDQTVPDVRNVFSGTDYVTPSSGEAWKLSTYAGVFDGIEPFAGDVPRGYLVDFLGTFTDAKFRTLFGVDPANAGGAYVETALPELSRDGEGWFEAVDWVMAAREASGSYVMMTLGACYGAQAVGASRALQLVNPMPFKLVAVEPMPENMRWVEKHLRDNGIDPKNHWLVQLAISDRLDPVYFPVGAPGSGAQNCYSTNEVDARNEYVRQLSEDPQSALRDLILTGRTGITRDLVPGEGWSAEICLLSAITLKELLGPFERVDYLESDIQQSEILVFPPYIELLREKVYRIHIGTHGGDVHAQLADLFGSDGWEIVFNFAPNSTFETDLGAFATNDGILTVRNPVL